MSNNSGDTLPAIQPMWDYNDPAATEKKFLEVLPRAEASDDREYHAELITQIARTQGLRRMFDEAHATLDEAEAMLTDDMDFARVRYYLERGRTFNSSGKQEEAKPMFLKAWEVATQTNLDGLAVDAAHMLGIVEPDKDGLAWHEKALELANASDDPDAKRWKASLRNNIGWSYHETGEYEKALGFFEQALEQRLEQGNTDNIRIARWSIARCLRSLNRVEEALAIQRELEKEIAKLDNPDGYVYEELAECLYALERQEEARLYIKKAHEILSKDAWLVENEKERIERLKVLSESE